MDLHLRRGLALVALAALCVGCDDPALSILSFAVPTEVAVDPSDFLGDTSCSENPGAMRSYVMTLSAFEDETDTVPFSIGSTVPTPCSLVAGFREVIVIGQRHIAEVDGYDVPVTQLTPFGGGSSGSRQMRSVETGEIVPPRWSTRCGASNQGGAIAEASRRVFVRPCDPIVDDAPTPTMLTIGPTQVLGDDACTLAPTFDLSPEATNLPETTDVACDAEALSFEVAPGVSYDLYATTLIEGVAYGAICSATAVRGVTVTAKCNPLSSTGRANIQLSNLNTGAEEPLCPAGAFFDVVSGEDVLNAVPLPCSNTAQVGPLAGGLELLDVIVFNALGLETARGSCAAEVAPGKTTTALCVADD